MLKIWLTVTKGVAKVKKHHQLSKGKGSFLYKIWSIKDCFELNVRTGVLFGHSLIDVKSTFVIISLRVG